MLHPDLKAHTTPTPRKGRVRAYGPRAALTKADLLRLGASSASCGPPLHLLLNPDALSAAPATLLYNNPPSTGVHECDPDRPPHAAAAVPQTMWVPAARQPLAAADSVFSTPRRASCIPSSCCLPEEDPQWSAQGAGSGSEKHTPFLASSAFRLPSAPVLY
jgi:hypothetical protein